jgi:tRNA A37 N6-isopentenylltransferase MiaA
LTAVRSHTAGGRVLVIVGGTGFAAVELTFVAIALAALEAAVAVFTGATDKGAGRHDFLSFFLVFS